MRTAKRNKQKMYYSLLLGDTPVYETDEDGNIKYITVDGNKIPVETGETEIGYSEPKECFMSLTMSGGETEDKAFGISISDYDATCIAPKNAYPIAEGTLIWHKSEIVFKDENKTIPDSTSADYVVRKCSESLNFTKYVLQALDK
jgi:hypothetical protein